MNDLLRPAEKIVQNSRNQRVLLGALFSLSVADGLLTRFIITQGLGREGNLWLTGLASSDALIAVKIVGTLLAIYLLWLLHYRRPKLVMGITIALMCWYTLVVFWNIMVVIFAVRA